MSFSCDPGYILRGNSFLACKQSQNTFIWSSHPPQCELDPGPSSRISSLIIPSISLLIYLNFKFVLGYCAKLTQPPDSYSMSCTKSACPVGTIVLLGCKENFEPVRSSVIMCTRPSSDPAEWTSTPLCIPLTEESGRSRNSGKLRRKLSELDNKPN